MKTCIPRIGILGIVLLHCIACMNIGSSPSSATRYYLLESKLETAAIPKSGSELSEAKIGVGPVTLPPYLDRPQLVTRLSSYELKTDDFSQWAEPLKNNITRVLAENLSILTGTRIIRSYPWKRSAVIDIQIVLKILRFDAGPNGEVILKTGWDITKLDNRQLLKEKQSTITQSATGKSAEELVHAMSMALTDLSREIAESLVIFMNNSNVGS